MKFIETINYLYEFFQRKISTTSRKRYISYLKKKGVKIGNNVRFSSPKYSFVDISKPYLISIGNDCLFTKGIKLLTHSADWFVLREIYKRPFGSAGKITIGNNVMVGVNTVILKDVSIGNNVVIGAGSIVTKNIPNNSVAAGNPAKVIFSIEELYQKYLKREKKEVKLIATSIKKRFNRMPRPEDFNEHFYLFLNRNPKDFGKINVKRQVGKYMQEFLNSEPEFQSFEDFLDFCFKE